MGLNPSPSLRHELRNEAVACLAISLDLSPGKAWPAFPVGTRRIAFDGELLRYARSDQQGNVSIRRVADDAEISRLPAVVGNADLTFTFDGQFLITGDLSWKTRVWKIDDSPPSIVFERDAGPKDVHSRKPLVAIGLKDHSFEVLDLKTRQARVVRTGFPVIALAWRPAPTRSPSFTRRE